MDVTKKRRVTAENLGGAVAHIGRNNEIYLTMALCGRVQGPMWVGGGRGWHGLCDSVGLP